MAENTLPQLKQDLIEYVKLTSWAIKLLILN
jgi:hypothetical protein